MNYITIFIIKSLNHLKKRRKITMSNADKFIGNFFEHPMDWFGISDETLYIAGMTATRLYDDDIERDDPNYIYSNYINYILNDNIKGISSNIRRFKNSSYKYQTLTGLKTDYSDYTYVRVPSHEFVGIGKNHPATDDIFVDNIRARFNERSSSLFGNLKHYNHLDNGGYSHLDRSGFYRWFQVSNKIENDGIIVSSFFFKHDIPFGVAYGIGYGYFGLALNLDGSIWYPNSYMKMKSYDSVNKKLTVDIIDKVSLSITASDIIYPADITADYGEKFLVTNGIYDVSGGFGGGGLRVSYIVTPSNDIGIYNGLQPDFYDDLFPVVHLIDNRKLITKTTDDKLISQTKKKMRYLGLDLDEFVEKAIDVDTIEDDAVRDSMEECVNSFIGFFIDLNDKSELAAQILFEMIDGVYDDLKQDNGDGSYRIGISYHDFGNVIIDFDIRFVDRYDGTDTIGHDRLTYEREDTCYGLHVIYLYKYHDGAKRTIVLANITVRYIVVDEKRYDYEMQHVDMDSCVENTSPILPLVPISYGAYRSLKGKDKRLFATHFLYLVNASVHVEKVHYWETQNFSDFIKKLSLAITIATIGGASSVSEAVKTIVLNLLIARGIEYIFDITDNRFVRALAVIGGAYLSYKYSGTNPKWSKATILLKSVEATNTYATLQMRFDMKEFEHEIDMYYQNYQERIDELKEKEKELSGDNGDYDVTLGFMNEFNNFQLTLPQTETYDDFMKRSMAQDNNLLELLPKGYLPSF